MPDNGSAELRYSVSLLSGAVENAYNDLLPHQNVANCGGKLKWKYDANPAGCGMISLASTGEENVGMIGAVALEIRSGERRLRALQALDTVVSPAARGRGCFIGMGQKLQEQAKNQGFDAIFGFPNANAARGWFGKLRWTRIGDAPFLFKPMRSGYFTRKLLPASIDVAIAYPRRSGRDIREIERFDERADTIWKRFAGSEICGVERGHTYLNWRLFDCPSASYQCFGMFDGETILSYVALRMADKHGGRIGYIMEALGDQTLPELLEDVLARAKDMGAEAMLAWCPPAMPNRSAYSRNGFWRLPKRVGPEIHLGGRPFTPDGEPLFSRMRWYVSYLDSDTV